MIYSMRERERNRESADVQRFFFIIILIVLIIFLVYKNAFMFLFNYLFIDNLFIAYVQ